MTALDNFRKRNQEFLTGLQGQIEGLRTESENSEGYWQLAYDLEAYRDFVRDFLDDLPEGERRQVEDQLPDLFPLVQEAHDLACEAYKLGILPENLSHSIGMMGNSLLFVSCQSKVVVPGGYQPRLKKERRHGKGN